VFCSTSTDREECSGRTSTARDRGFMIHMDPCALHTLRSNQDGRRMVSMTNFRYGDVDNLSGWRSRFRTDVPSALGQGRRHYGRPDRRIDPSPGHTGQKRWCAAHQAAQGDDGLDRDVLTPCCSMWDAYTTLRYRSGIEPMKATGGTCVEFTLCARRGWVSLGLCWRASHRDWRTARTVADPSSDEWQMRCETMLATYRSRVESGCDVDR
jgi:hypothetical protein